MFYSIFSCLTGRRAKLFFVSILFLFLSQWCSAARASAHPQKKSDIYKVKGITVTAAHPKIIKPENILTNYRYSEKLIQEVFPGPEGLNLQNILQTLPGAAVSTDNYFGADTLHVRGGTGNDLGFALDGTPLYEPITGTFDTGLASPGITPFGMALINNASSYTNFYVGAYPVQYGNFLSGYLNEKVEQGEGKLHGTLEFQSGFWLDPGSHLPLLNPDTQNVSSYQGEPFPSPFNFSLKLAGQIGRFHYFFSQLGENGANAENGAGPFAEGVDLKPLLYLGSSILAAYNEPLRDTLLNLNFHAAAEDQIQLLLQEGFSTSYYFGENPELTALIPMPDENVPQKDDLEKLEWRHEFNQKESLSISLWRYDTDTWLNFYDSPYGSTAEWLGAWEKGVRLQYQDQFNPENLVDFGGSYLYSSNRYFGGISLPDPNGPYFSSLLQEPFGVFETTANPEDNIGVGVPDTQTMAVWLSDDWQPTQNFSLYAGLRWDRQNYLIPNSSDIVISPSIAPDDPSTSAIENQTLLTNNGSPFSLPGCSSPGVPNYCFDPGFLHPSFITPRLGASYQMTHKLTLKADYGKFFTFAPARNVALIKTISGTNPYTGLPTGIPADFVDTPAVYMKPGSRPQFGETYDLSLQYHFNHHTYLEITPYLKQIQNPLLYTLLPNGSFVQVNAGVIHSRGVEFLLKTENWKGLSGWLDYTYSKTIGNELPVQTVDPANLGVPSSVTASNANTLIPVPYDIPNLANLVLEYKIPGTEIQIAPNLDFQSGQAYGLGFYNLCGLASFEGIGSGFPTCSGVPNPLHETTPDSLRFGGALSGNLAITDSMGKEMSLTLSILNLWNNSQTSDPFTQSYFFTPVFGYTQIPSYNPLEGDYYNLHIPLLRQYILTMKFKF